LAVSVDWFSGLLGYDASALRLPKLLALTVDGVIDWETERMEQAEGSWSSRLLVGRGESTAAMRAWAEENNGLWSPHALRLSGNPAKFLQGHNVFGPSVGELGSVLRETVRRLPEILRPADADVDAWPSLHRSRIDIALAVDLGGHRAVHEWLQVAASSTRSRHGRAMVSGDTVYWGKNSRRWSLKGYCKFCELDDHRPAEYYDELKAYCEQHLRLELTLRRPELRERATLNDEVVWEFYEKVVIGVSTAKLVEMDRRVEEFGLPRRIQDVLALWLDGRDVRHGVPRRTFYRWRSAIMEAVGVDISLPRDEELPELGRLGFDVEYLRSRQVKGVPEGLQGLLFKAGEVPAWRVA
jgi:hypothetical protein